MFTEESGIEHSLKLVEAALNALPAHIAIIDAKGNIVSVNAAWKRFAEENGWSSSLGGVELNYFSLFNSSTEDETTDDLIVSQVVEEVIAGNTDNFYLEYPFKSLSEKRWFGLRLSRFKIDDEVFVVCSHEDISTAKRAEKELQKIEERFQRLADSNMIGVVVGQLDGAITEANDAFLQIIGRTREDLNEGLLTFRSLFPKDEDPQTRRVLIELRRTGTCKPFETTYVCESGLLVSLFVRVTILDVSANIGIALVADLTKRKQAEEQQKLLAEERDKLLKRLQLILNRMPIGCMMSDADFRINYWNPKAEKIFGYTQEEVTGKLPYDVFVPPSAKKYVQSLQRRLARGDFDANGVYECVTKDGLIIICEWHNTPIMDSKGKVIGHLAMVHDVTERKIVEETLRESENRFRTMADTAPVLIWMSGVDKKHFYFNKTWLKFTGRTLEEEIGHGWSKGVHSDDRAKCLRIYETSFDTRSEFEIEYRLRRYDGEYRWILGTGIPRFTSDGNFLGYIGSCIDITERRQAEENLRESEARFRNMADNAPVMIWVTDAEGVCHYQSQSWYEFTGMTPETGLEFGWKDAIHPEDRRRVFQNFVEANKKREHYTIEYRLRKKNGEYAWVFSSTSPRFGPQGEFLGFIGSIVDMTERKKTEEALRESEEQLRQSQKMEAIGKLAGGVAHDYNNLMAVIMLHADLLLAQLEDDDPQRNRVEEIRSATDRAASLTRQLLAFSRKQVLQPRVINLNTVVTDMNKMLHRLIGEDIELHIDLDPSLGLVMTDPDQMAQVIMNLVVNARDAMPQGGLLTIETENTKIEESGGPQDSLSPGNYVVLTISDTGCGIPDDIQQRVFEPFFTTKEHGKGTGLGLSTVYGIINQSGGCVFLDSEQGQGTSFTIFLPRVDEKVEVEKKQEPVQVTNFRGNETVLLVEDEEMVRRVARDVLEKLGYKVLEARSGHDALQAAEEYDGAIDLLLTDVIMPKMSGKELADKLTPARSRMKILYMSGYTDEAIVHHGVLEEGTNFIEKPFSPFRLAQKVRDVLNS